MVEEAKKLTVTMVLFAAIALLIGFGVFLFLGGMIASFAAKSLHISPMEGAQGYFAVSVGTIWYHATARAEFERTGAATATGSPHAVNLPAAAFAKMTGEITTDRNGADVILEKPEWLARRGYVPLYYSTSHRFLAFKFPEGGARLYNLRASRESNAEKISCLVGMAETGLCR